MLFPDEAGTYPPYVQNHCNDLQLLDTVVPSSGRDPRASTFQSTIPVVVRDLKILFTKPEKMTHEDYLSRIMKVVSDACDYVVKLSGSSRGEKVPRKEYTLKQNLSLPTTECEQLGKRLHCLCHHPSCSSQPLAVQSLKKAQMKMRELRTMMQYRSHAENVSQTQVMMSRCVFLQYGVLRDLLLSLCYRKFRRCEPSRNLVLLAQKLKLPEDEQLMHYYEVEERYRDPEDHKEQDELLGPRLLFHSRMFSCAPELALYGWTVPGMHMKLDDIIEDEKTLLELTFTWAEKVIQQLEKSVKTL